MTRQLLANFTLFVFRPAARLVLEISVLLVLWPAALVLGAVFLLVDLLATPFVVLGRRRPAAAAAEATPRRDASIIVVSWNGKDFLTRLLPSLYAAIDAHGGDHEVIVVDNGSKDDSIDYMRSNFPRTRIVALPENRFFVRGNMAGVAVATRDTLVFLNNDMIVKPDFLGPLLDGFTSPDVFGVAAEVFFRDPNKRREETGKTTGRFESGFLQLEHRMPSEADTALAYTPTFWAGGGSSAFDRKKFLEIGGWDLTFDPFYLEDAGLSYQAWKRGYRVLFTPRSGVFHEHRGTSRKAFGDHYIDSVIRRNQHLFLWRNVTSPRLTAKYFALLPLGILDRAAAAGHLPFTKALRFEVGAFCRALPRVPVVLWRRAASRRAYVRSDEQVVAVANHNRRLALASGAAPPGARLRILVLCARLPRLNTDGSWILFNLLRELSRRHDVSVFSLIDRPDEEEQANELRRFCARVTTHLRTRDVSVVDPHRLIPERLRYDFSAPDLRAAVRAQIETGDYDLLQVEYMEMAHIASRYVDDLPAVYTCHEPHNLFLHRLIAPARGLAKLTAWYRYVQGAQNEIGFTRAFRRVVTLSDVDQKNLERLVPGLSVRTIPSGIDLARHALPSGEAPEPGVVVFVGYFRHPPNIDAALWLVREIMPRVRAQEPGATLYLVGRDPSPEIMAHAGQDGTVVTGFVDDLAPYLRRASVVVAPIRLGGGLRGKVLEAWAAGKAVVATRIAAEGFAAVDGEHLLLADDAQGFADAVARVLRDGALRRRLAVAGHNLVEQRYSIAAAAKQYEQLYCDMLGIRRPPAVAAQPVAAHSIAAHRGDEKPT